MTIEGLTGLRVTAGASEFGDKLGAMEGRVVHAKVLEVQGSRAVLRIEGQVVIANSEIPLKASAEVDLYVRNVEGGRLQMQLVAEASERIRPMTDADISSRLIGFDIPPSRTTIAVSRTLIHQDLPVTKQNVQAILNALPPDATEEEIAFQVAAMKAGLAPSRETLPLRPLLGSGIQELPASMKELFGAIAQALRAAGAKPEADVAPLKQLDALPLAADFENAEELASKIAEFARNSLVSTEARLVSQLLPQAPATPSPSVNALIENMLLLMLSLASRPENRAQAAEIAANLSEVADGLAAAAADETAAPVGSKPLREQIVRLSEALRNGANEIRNAAGENDMARAAAIMGSLENETFRLVETLAREALDILKAASAAGATDTPADDAMTFNLIEDLLKQAQSVKDPEKAAELFKEIVLRAALQLLPGMAETASAAAPRQSAAFAGAVSWLIEALRVAGGERPEIPSETTAQAQTAPPPETAAVKQARIHTLLSELANLSRQAGDAADQTVRETDLRTLLGRITQSAVRNEGAREAAEQLGKNLQMASFSSLVEHSGLEPTNAITVFFPIHYGDRVDVGILKVHTDKDRKKDRKPLDPFNAVLVLILETDALGMSMTTINTYPKSLNCVIEVDTKRKVELLEKHADILREALRKTVYENTDVTIKQRKRRQDGGGKTGGRESAKTISAIDMRL